VPFYSTIIKYTYSTFLRLFYMGRIVLASSTAPLERYTYFARYLFHPENILAFSFVATSKTKTLHHSPPLLVEKLYCLLYGISRKRLAPLSIETFSHHELSPRTRLLCSTTVILPLKKVMNGLQDFFFTISGLQLTTYILPFCFIVFGLPMDA
jgi:hypothetical protein